MKKKIFAVMISIFLVIGFLPQSEKSYAFGLSDNAGSAAWQEKTAEQIVSEMTPEQQILQTFFMYFQTWNGKPFTEMNDEVKAYLQKYNFGGFVMFAGNCVDTQQTWKLASDFQKINTDAKNTPMLITTDQEGGYVFRLGSGTAMPGNMSLAATNNPTNSYTNGTIIGSELNSLCINTDYSPVVDVNNNANNPIIGVRSFGDDQNAVLQNGIQYFLGLNDTNTIACAKHFPGHGDVATDSHTGLPCVDKSYEQLKNCELVPFQGLINNGIDMVMTAHIQYPQVDTEKVQAKDGSWTYRPATVSKKILTDVLKGDMGFKGVVSTDGMHMAGLKFIYADDAEAAYQALNAGADMLCGPTSGDTKEKLQSSLDHILSYLEDKYNTEPAFANRIKDAATRIINLKQKRGILDYNPDEHTLDKALATVGNQQHHDTEDVIASQGVTLIKNENNLLPLRLNNNSKILFVNPQRPARPYAGLDALAWNRTKAAGLIPEGAQINSYTITDKDYEITGALKQAIDNADTVICRSAINNTSAMYNLFSTKCALATTQYCKENNKHSVVMSSLFPYDVQLYNNADAIMAYYNPIGTDEDFTNVINTGKTYADKAYGPNGLAADEVMFGLYGASGKLPVNIPYFDMETHTYKTDMPPVYNRGYGLTYRPIGDTDINDCDIALEYVKAKYDGSAKTPKVLVSSKENKTLIEGTDYTLDYKNNVEPGIATVTITGIGEYYNAVDKNFEIYSESPVPEVNPTNYDALAQETGNSAQTSDNLWQLVLIYGIIITIAALYCYKKSKITTHN